MRDDFSKNVIDNLAKRVGNHCSNPKCRKLTSGPHEDPTRVLNIGVGAHITAASPGGPRYDPNITSDERQGIQNGIWLCQNCAKLIDNDIISYNKDILIKWKTIAEAFALLEVEGLYIPKDDNPELDVEISIKYKTLKQEQMRHDYHMFIYIKNNSNVPLENYHVDVEIPSRIIENPEKQQFIVKERSSKERLMFRLNNNELHTRDVMPGDTVLMLGIEYCMTNEIYKSRGDLLDKTVRVTLFPYGYKKQVAEKQLKELQNF